MERKKEEPSPEPDSKEFFEVSKKLEEVNTRRRRLSYLSSVIGIFSVISGVLGSVVTSLGVSVSFSHLPQIPQAYEYLVGILLSSLAGISIVFLIARQVYQQRKKDRVVIIEGVRSTETGLFQVLHLDFERLIERREIHGR